MKFKKFKYNIICLILILCVAVAVVIKVGFIDTQIPDSQLTTPVPPNQTDTPTNPSNPSQDDDKQQPEEQTPPPVVEEEADPNLKRLSRFPLQMLGYSINKLVATNSYQGDIYYICNFEVLGMDITAKQLCEGTTIKQGDQLYEGMTFHSDDTAKKYTGFAMNHTNIRYWDGTLGQTWRTNTGEYDLSRANYSTTDQCGGMGFYYDFFYPGNIEFSTSCATGTWTSQYNERTGKQDYVITVKMSKTEGYPEAFLRNYRSFSSGLEIVSLEQQVTFNIDEYSGWIRSFTKVDKMIGKTSFAGLSIQIGITASYTETITNINQPIQITVPPVPQQ